MNFTLELSVYISNCCYTASTKYRKKVLLSSLFYYQVLVASSCLMFQPASILLKLSTEVVVQKCSVIAALENFCKIDKKTLAMKPLFYESWRLACNFCQTWLHNRCFFVSFAIFFRTAILCNTCEELPNSNFYKYMILLFLAFRFQPKLFLSKIISFEQTPICLDRTEFVIIFLESTCK